MSLFVIPTFHASSSVLLEVAVAQSSAYNGADAGGVLDKGSARQSEEAMAAYMGSFPRNASDLESRGNVNGWSISNAHSTEGSALWQACRYYEVGDIQDDIRQVISNATFGEELGSTPLSMYFEIASEISAQTNCDVTIDMA